ncbi:MAG TPA: hypothetical protein VFZ87_10190, partial [Gemmatimonadales bacterium]
MASPTRPARSKRSKQTRPAIAPADRGDYGEAFPHSTKVYIEGPHGIRVPMREIALAGGEPPLRVYDTSGPLGLDVRQGLPSVRGEWIRGRARGGGNLIPEALYRPVLRGRGPVTQLHYARRGEITPEMEFVALR